MLYVLQKLNQQENRFASIYPRLLGGLIVAASILVLFSGGLSLVYGSPAEFNQIIFLVSLATSVPFGLIFCAIGKVVFDRLPISSMFWIRKPTSETSTIVEKSYEVYLKELIRKLESEGFEYEFSRQEEGLILITCYKAKQPETIGFSDHSFEGEILLEQVERNKTRLISKLSFNDIVLIETGELSDLRNYSNEILNLDSDEILRDLPFTLVSGTCLSLALIVPIFFDMKVFSTQDILVSGGLAALGMIFMGSFHIYKTDSRQVGGYAIGALAAAFSIFLILSGLL